jgi:hypothetical protein
MSLLDNLLGSSVTPDTDECAVSPCEWGANIEVVELKPFDPIDHNAVYVPLCDHHQAWADERNEFAESLADELRSYRAELGHKRIDRVNELQEPPKGELNRGMALDTMEQATDMMRDMMEDSDNE